MTRIVVAGSENDTSFVVINFTIPGNPSVVPINPGFGAGCRVAIDGFNAAVGNVLGGNVRLVNVSNPHAPVLQGMVSTVLAGIGAIAIHGQHVAVGEFTNSFKARVVLIDFSSPGKPVILGTAQTPLASVATSPTETLAAISSLAFIGPNRVVASGPSDFEIVQVDFTNPTSAVVSTFNPALAGPPSIDADGNQIVAGDTTSGIIKLFNASTQSLAGSINSRLPSITSIAFAAPLVLAASQSAYNVVRISFSDRPTATSFDPGLRGGCTTAIKGTIGACGAIWGTEVKLVDLTPATPVVLGTADAGIPSISTLAINQ